MQRHFQQAKTLRTNGFSLFELLIVMTIIVTITAMAAPNMMERVRNGRVQEAAEDVREVMAFARQQAIDSGVDYHVRFEVNGQAVVAIPSEPQPTLVNQAGSNSSQAEVLVMSLVLEPEKMFLRADEGRERRRRTTGAGCFCKSGRQRRSFQSFLVGSDSVSLRWICRRSDVSRDG
jgi:prepilin-type N-terminal cleavage/methylation domain-containing protein